MPNQRIHSSGHHRRTGRERRLCRPPPQGQFRGCAPKEVVAAYRYVSERLRHRLRNTMLSAQSQANRLKSAASTGANPDIQVALAKMNDALLSLSRELEATDADPQHFQQRSIALGDWLRNMDIQYTSRYSSLNLKLVNADGTDIRVLASNYLLETVFWNIWLNAHQAAGAIAPSRLSSKPLARISS